MSDGHALHVLRGVLNRLQSQPGERDHWDAARARAVREAALLRYGLLLSPERVAGIDKEGFLTFLRDENRQHTMGLGRGVSMTADMPRLREALAVLVDERLTLAERLDRLRPPGGVPMVKGLGPSVITAFLHFVDPQRYGILNGASERVMRRLGLYPDLPTSASLAERYEAVNRVLLRVASALGVELSLLDALWWRVQPQALADFGARRPVAPDPGPGANPRAQNVPGSAVIGI